MRATIRDLKLIATSMLSVFDDRFAKFDRCIYSVVLSNIFDI